MKDNQALLELVAVTTQEECREMGKLLLEMAERPRDVSWKAMFAEQRKASITPQQFDLAQCLSWETAMDDTEKKLRTEEGLSERQLVIAELARRNDPRSYDAYHGELHDKVYAIVGPRGAFRG